MRIREATSDDHDFLLDMLLEAFNWTGEQRFSRAQLLVEPHTDRYLGGWKRAGDFGLVAVGGAPGVPLGAIWARALAASDAGYGYVADDVPELGMAVAPEHRRLGIASALLARCLEQARGLGWRAVSLSVEEGNRAAKALYTRHGFFAVGRTGRSDTMLRQL